MQPRVYFERAENLQQQITNSTVDLSAYLFPFSTIFAIGLNQWLFYLTIVILIFVILIKE